MTLVPVVQFGMAFFPEQMLPSRADRDDDRAEFFADPRVSLGYGSLGFGRVAWRPSHVENCLRTGRLDRLIEESNVLVHALGVLDRQCALLLKHDEVVATLLDRL